MKLRNSKGQFINANRLRTKRLTEKGTRKCAIRMVGFEEQYKKATLECDMYNKLAELEDIEEELGIDSIILLKALKNEYIFIKQDNKIYENDVEFSFNRDKKGWYINLEVCHFDKLYFKDYGKTWALAKKELQ